MTDATARYVITADDRTKAALHSIKSNFKDLDDRAKLLSRSLGGLGGAVSVVGLGRFAARLADSAQQARDSTDSIDAMRASLGAWTQQLSDRDLETLAALGDTFDRTADAARGFGASIVAGVAPALRELAAGVRTLVGGATDLEKLNTQLDFLRRMKGTGFLSLGYGDFGTGIVTPSEVREGIARAEGRRQSILDTMDGMRSGRLVGDLPEVVVTASGAESRSRTERERETAARARLNLLSLQKSREDFLASIDRGATDTMRSEIADVLAKGDAERERVAEQLRDWRQFAREAADETSVFWDQAMRNMQSSLARFLATGEGGLRGMAGALRDLAAEWAASEIFKAIGIGSGKGGSGSTGGTIASFLGSFFGGARAMGGPVAAGSAYLVGERGPELFVPGRSGGIVPNHAMGGQTVVAPVYNISGLGLSYEQVQTLMAANTRELTRLLARNNRLKF